MRIKDNLYSFILQYKALYVQVRNFVLVLSYFKFGYFPLKKNPRNNYILFSMLKLILSLHRFTLNVFFVSTAMHFPFSFFLLMMEFISFQTLYR